MNYLGVVTGKPLELHGIDGRAEATGLGMYYTIREVLNDLHYLKRGHLSRGIKGKSCIVQGFGNVGSWFSKFWHDNGGKIIGVVEHDGSIYNNSVGGIDINALWDHFAKTGSIKGMKGCKTFNDNRVLFEKCDVLAPAALEQ